MSDAADELERATCFCGANIGAESIDAVVQAHSRLHLQEAERLCHLAAKHLKSSAITDERDAGLALVLAADVRRAAGEVSVIEERRRK